MARATIPAPALQAVLARGDALSSIRGVPALRHILADHLADLHARPVAEGRVQVTALGVAAVSAALAGVVRAGNRVVPHVLTWPNPASAALLRGATVDALPPDARQDGGFHLDLDRLAALT